MRKDPTKTKMVNDVGEFFKYTNKKRGTSPYWLLLSLISVIGLPYMAVAGISFASAMVFVILFTFTMTVELSTIVNMWGSVNIKDYTVDSMEASAFGYLLGAGVFLILGSIGGFSMGVSSIFSVSAEGMTNFWYWFLNVFMAGFIEEAFWLLTVPIITWMLLSALGKHIEPLKNKYIKMTLIIIISSVSFALFHVNQAANMVFIISAIVFRSFFVLIYWGDMKLNLITFTAVPASFMVGAHQMHNWLATEGLMGGFSLLFENLFTFTAEGLLSWLILGFFLITLFLSYVFIRNLIIGKGG